MRRNGGLTGTQKRNCPAVHGDGLRSRASVEYVPSSPSALVWLVGGSPVVPSWYHQDKRWQPAAHQLVRGQPGDVISIQRQRHIPHAAGGYQGTHCLLGKVQGALRIRGLATHTHTHLALPQRSMRAAVRGRTGSGP